MVKVTKARTTLGWRTLTLLALGFAALLLLPVLAANTVGEACVAWLYWRDRQ